jgi:hypothetical protein
MPKGLRSIRITVGERGLTHFGGIVLIQRFCKKLRLKWHLQHHVKIPQRSSHYHPVELILAIIYALIAGIYRLKKTRILQGNGSFQQVIGLKSFPYASSLRRFLKRADHRTIQSIIKVHDYLRQKMFRFCVPKTSLLFDLDSSAITVYGKFIEEAKVGYNPGKKGKRSYHPLFCFETNSRDSWHSILRPGNTGSSTGVVEFFNVCLNKLPPYIYRIRVRADAGFYNLKLIRLLEEKNIGYVIVARITKPIKWQLEGLRYYRFRRDWAAAEFHYTPHKWKNLRRFIVIRRPLPEKDSDQLTLFTLKRYSYQVFVTNLPLKPANVWYFYRGRALIEKYIRELKENFALAKIPTNNFMANQFYFHLLLLAYNIVNWFKRICLPLRFRNATLETVRSEFLVIPARLVKTGNRNTLKLPAEYIPEHFLENILQKIDHMKPL